VGAKVLSVTGEGGGRVWRSVNRRDLLARSACLSAAALAARSGALAAPAGAPTARLETRLFNLKPDLAPDDAAAAVSRFKARAGAAGLNGFMIGRNENSIPFPTRLEWMYMAQWPGDGSAPSSDAPRDFIQEQDALASLCRDQAICDVACPLPDRFADAAGVKVRHVVMFSFKPEASPADRARDVEAIRAMGRMPMVQNYLVEPHAPSASGPDQMDWQVIGDFAGMAEYKAYSNAPAHLSLRDDFRAHTSRVAFLDVEL
jgi:hypothetical protein